MAAVILALQVQPAISLTPDTGQPGSSFTVSGTGFTPGERVKISWDGTNLGGTAKVTDNGTFVYSGLVPDGVVPGSHTVAAQVVGGSSERATAMFTVEAPSTSTSTTVSTTTTSPTTSTTSGTATTQATSKPGSATTVPSSTETPAPDAQEDGAEAVSTTLADPSQQGVQPAVANNGEGPSGPDSTDQAIPKTTTPSTGVGGLVVGLVAVALMAGATLFMWRRSRDAEDETFGGAGASDDAPSQDVPLIAAADLAAKEADWTRSMMTLTPDGDINAVARSGIGLIGFGQTKKDEGWGDVVIWNSQDAIAWTEAARLEEGSTSFAIPWRHGWMLASSHEKEHRIDTRVWSSDDGRRWEPLTETGDPSLRGVSFEGAVQAKDIVAAWGRGPEGAGVWTSRDGAAWLQSPFSGSIDLIAGTGAGFVAFGREPGRRRPIVAHSTDGVSWAPLDRDSLFVFDGISIATHVSLDGGMIVAGTDLMRGMAVILASDDGRRWVRAPFEPEPGTSIEHLASVGEGLVAVGVDTGTRRRGRSSLAVWESRDAVAWERAPVEDLFADATASSTLAVDESILVFGNVFLAADGARLESIPVTWRWSGDGPSVEAEPAMAFATETGF